MVFILYFDLWGVALYGYVTVLFKSHWHLWLEDQSCNFLPKENDSNACSFKQCYPHDLTADFDLNQASLRIARPSPKLVPK